MIETSELRNLERQWPNKQFEYVTVTFAGASVDTAIPYTRLRPETPMDICWLDVSRHSIDTGGGVEAIPALYRCGLSTAKPWTTSNIYLRSNAANYTTTVLLFIPRTEN